MSPSLKKAISRLVPRSGAGGSHLERLRSTIFALLGAVTAVGLGIVALASNQGWTNFIDLPIPGAPSQHVGDARVVAQAPPPPAGSTGPEVVPSGQGQAPVPDRDQPSGAPSTNGQSTGGIPAPPSHDPKAPSKQGGAGEPAAETPAGVADPGPGPGKGPAAVPTSPPDAEGQPVATSPPGKGKAKGHGKEKSPKPAKAPPPPAEDPPPPESSDDYEDGDEGDDDDDDGESHGNGNANGHDDDDGDDDDD